MRKPLIIFLFFFISSISLGQIIIQGVVTDSSNGKVLAGVHVYNIQSHRGGISDVNGNFQIQVTKLPSKLTFSHIGYKMDTIVVISAVSLLIKLVSIPLQMNEFKIGAIQKVVKNEEIYILDYEIIHPYFVILGYSERYNRSNVFLIDSIGDTLCKTAIAGKAGSLLKDCQGNVLLQNDYETYIVKWDLNSIRLDFLYYNTDEGLHLPCNGIINDKMLTSFYISNQLVAFADISFKDSVLNYFRIIDNRNVYNMPENWGLTETGEKVLNLNYLNSLNGNPIAFNVENTVLFHSDLYAESEGNGSLSKLAGYSGKYLSELFYYKHVIDKPIYVPLISFNNQVFLFNHVDGVMEVYDNDLKMTDKIKIDYHTKPNWKPTIIFDEINKKTYTLYEKAGVQFLAEISLYDGKFVKSIKLPFSFVTEIKVVNGKVYFLYLEKSNYSTERLVKKLFRINA